MSDKKREYIFELTEFEGLFLAVRLELIVKEFADLAADPHLSEGKRAIAVRHGEFFRSLAEKTRATAKA